MSERTQKILDGLNEIESCYSGEWPWQWYDEVVDLRCLILKVQEWEYKAWDLLQLYGDSWTVKDSYLEDLLKDIRDFGEIEEKTWVNRR
jgi:hypothetical protein